jgi:hypothetical protein
MFIGYRIEYIILKLEKCLIMHLLAPCGDSVCTPVDANSMDMSRL